MKCDKKFLGKKKKKEESSDQEENNIKQNDNENDTNEQFIDNNNLNKEKNNINIDSVKNDTLNNSILISKKNNSSNNTTSTLFLFNKTTDINKDIITNEKEAPNKNEIINKFITNNNSINNINNIAKENNLLQKNNPINSTITSKYKNTNSVDSDNSEDSESSSPQVPKGSQSKNANANLKFKSHLQNSRNTAFGLKEISKKVMDIIKQNGKTTYKAISDQIVNDIQEKNEKDEKNIRRRIYDSLNVMKSMKLFNRDKDSKTIMWNYDKEFDPLNEIENKNDGDEKNNEYKIDSGNIVELKKNIKEKKEKVSMLTKELRGLKNVLERNRREDENIPENNKLYFPFIVIEFSNNKDPKINVALNDNQTKAHFGFDEADAMYGDLDAVSKVGNHPNFLNKD